MRRKTSILLLFPTVLLLGQLLRMPAAAADMLPLDDPVRLNDMVITALMPAVTDAVEQFYAPYLTIAPTVATYYETTITDILGGERIHAGISNSRYTVTVEVMPYVGPHVAVGRDRVVLRVTPRGVTVTGYEHYQTCTLPAHLRGLLRPNAPAPIGDLLRGDEAGVAVDNCEPLQFRRLLSLPIRQDLQQCGVD